MGEIPHFETPPGRVNPVEKDLPGRAFIFSWQRVKNIVK
ncbi:hypothetical protein AB434_2922 [Heyndrickxia coagulans]|jgi:hypothetical protein|uniref:Uncharacterized protein n=1 Tax=Heyndrickxia coagulans TaxID=1398 RepID=A0AAN0T6Q1_HEYCO|nr:hypothetical protein SB48_HM08orf03750 [Heyndrickxia coagulans]AKN55327.1 hypothetical protein AB434_2922 [Heyndrickxia coagulans]KYC59064.1 hypothetical protein B4100_3565 [Heyndrickxia coagulans]KYC88471.1 hypothetical protein B4096_3451 [Heyndrickxia coagulans]